MNLSSSLVLMLSAAAGVEKVQSFSFRLMLIIDLFSTLPICSCFNFKVAAQGAVSGYTYIGDGLCADHSGQEFKNYGTNRLLDPGTEDPAACGSWCLQMSPLPANYVGFYTILNMCHCAFSDALPVPKPTLTPSYMKATVILALGLYVDIVILILTFIAMHTMHMGLHAQVLHPLQQLWQLWRLRRGQE